MITMVSDEMVNLTKINAVLSEFSDNPEKLELFYIFLVSYYRYYREYIEYAVRSGGRWVLLDDLVYEQFRIRGFEPYELFDTFREFMITYKVNSEEAHLLIKTIETRYSSLLRELINKRITGIDSKQKDLLKEFVTYYFFVEEGREYIDWGSFIKLKERLGEESFNELYRLLLSRGIIIVHGYRSITSRGPVDHIGLKIPPWARQHLESVFKDYIAYHELASRKILQELEEKLRGKCPICGKPIGENQKYTVIYGFKIHYDECYKVWRERLKNIHVHLSSDYGTTLAKEFLALDIIKGNYSYEVPVSKKSLGYPFLGSRRVDLVISSDDTDWIIEVERKLNYEAIGQVLVYATLWRINNPHKKIAKAIVTEYADKELLEVAKILNIKVFTKV